MLAFYYGWYGNSSDRKSWGEVNTNKYETSQTARYPLNGPYSSHDPAIVDWQIDQAKSHGITGFVVSWWGTGPEASWHEESMQLLLDRAEKKNFKLSIYWEQAPDIGQGQIDRAIGEIAYVLKRYGQSSAFLKVDNKPVIFAYNRVNLFQVPVSSWPSIIEGIRQRAGDFVLIGDGQQSSSAYLFDGIHSYGLTGLPDTFGQKLTTEKLDAFRSWVASYYGDGVKIARQRNKISCLMVKPGDDARKAYKWNTQMDRLDGQTYRTLWEEAIKANPDWVIITSWNEWLEGTEIEPSRELGEKYLQITAEYSKRFLGSPPVRAPDPRPLSRAIAGVTNDLTTILLNRKVGVLAQDSVNDTEFWLAYCGASIHPLEWKDLINPKLFNATDLPVFVHIANEHYMSSIKVTDDVTRALSRYLHEGGFYVSLPPSSPWPLNYDDSRKGIPHCITDTLDLGIDNGFELPPSGADLKFYVSKKALLGLTSPITFPTNGDLRFRPANHSRVFAADYYLPLVQLWDAQMHPQGEAAVYIEHRTAPLSPGKSIYVWMRTAEALGPDEFYPSLYQFISTKLKPLPSNP
ncbi:MAG TPA: glycoside hydrolase family 99-like domain-containing protein [Verrucomicrobiae bacterium]|nr:glycoside hydrolase family 99-like domain-containing protein [Verrucomicrobiae bacterium]